MKQNLKILVSMIVAFLVVILYGRLSNGGNVKNIFSGLKFNPSSLTKLFTLNFNVRNDNLPLVRQNGGSSYFDLSVISSTPTEVPKEIISPTVISVFSQPTSPTVVITKASPTVIPKSTKTPKPTKVPTPTMMTIGTVRPGNSLQEIAQIAQNASCTPAALLLGVKSIETGQSFFNTSTSTFKTYNTYGWWENAGLSCGGFGYNTITGIVPVDSADAGKRCQNPVGVQSASGQGIMGLMQLNQMEQAAYTDDFQRAFKVGEVDRRILFDAMVIAGFHFKNISLERSKDCVNWDLKYVAKMACKYQGVCKYDYGTGNNIDYCQAVCEAYGKFGGPKLNCAKIADTLKAGTCDFK
jgi:hypothetical protein